MGTMAVNSLPVVPSREMLRSRHRIFGLGVGLVGLLAERPVVVDIGIASQTGGQSVEARKRRRSSALCLVGILEQIGADGSLIIPIVKPEIAD